MTKPMLTATAVSWMWSMNAVRISSVWSATQSQRTNGSAASTLM